MDAGIAASEISPTNSRTQTEQLLFSGTEARSDREQPEIFSKQGGAAGGKEGRVRCDRAR
jgi:hypothetical protein